MAEMVRKIRRHHSLNLLIPCFLLLLLMGCSKGRAGESVSLGCSPPSSVSSLLLRIDAVSNPESLHGAIMANGHPSSVASYWTGLVLFANGSHSDAAKYFSQAQAEGLEKPLADYCRMALADITFMGGDSASALSCYEEYITSERLPQLRFLLLARLAAASYAVGKKSTADNWLTTLQVEFPRPSASLTTPAAIYDKLKSDSGIHNGVILQLGVFSSRERANSILAEIAKAGLAAKVSELEGMWMVFLGPYGDKSKAEYDAAKLKPLGLHSYIKTWNGR